MTTVYKTYKKTDASFAAHIWGRHDSQTRAVPVKTYHAGTSEETVTFELRPLADIHRPGFFLFVAELVKVRSFILFLFPLFYVLAKNFLDDRIFDPFSMICAWVTLYQSDN